MPRLPKATRIACIPVRTAHKPPIKFDHFPALLHAQNTFYGLRRAIQSSANPGKTTSKTFANLCHRNILTASRRTRKTTFIFLGRTARNSQVRRQADTSCLCDRAATSALSRHRPGDSCFAASESFQFFALISSLSGCASNPEFEKILQNIRGWLDRGG